MNITQGKSTDKLTCYGVSQGFYILRDMPTAQNFGTSSLGSCFACAIVCFETKKLFFSHVQNDSEVDMILGLPFKKKPSSGLAMFNYSTGFAFAMGDFGDDLSHKANTQLRIKRITDHYCLSSADYKILDYDQPAAVIYPPKQISKSFEIKSCPDIEATNLSSYLANNKIGQENQQQKKPLQPMDPSVVLTE